MIYSVFSSDPGVYLNESDDKSTTQRHNVRHNVTTYVTITAQHEEGRKEATKHQNIKTS